MRWGLVGALLIIVGRARAEDAVRLGGTAGATVSRSTYDPMYLLGIKGALDHTIVATLSLGLEARLQLYGHPEDEDFGSWGMQADLSALVRCHAFSDRSSRALNPFIAIRGGGAAVERVPFSSAHAQLIGGYLVGGTLGADLHVDNPIRRLEISFDMPSFTTHDDSSDPAGELSVVVAGGWD